MLHKVVCVFVFKWLFFLSTFGTFLTNSKVFFLSCDSIYGKQINELINKKKMGWGEEIGVCTLYNK